MENFWAFVIIGGPILLGLAIAYGTIQYFRRDRRLDAASDESARELRDELRREESEAR